MTTSTQSLAGWLLEQIAEDEAVARAAFSGVGVERLMSTPQRAHVARWNPARVLAECESKRALIKRHSEEHECPVGETAGGWWDDEWPCDVLRLLALPYADHDGYRDEWAV